MTKLTRTCRLGLQTMRCGRLKFGYFKNLTWRATAILEIENLQYLHTNHAKKLKFAYFQNSTWRTAAILEMENFSDVYQYMSGILKSTDHTYHEGWCTCKMSTNCSKIEWGNCCPKALSIHLQPLIKQCDTCISNEYIYQQALYPCLWHHDVKKHTNESVHANTVLLASYNFYNFLFFSKCANLSWTITNNIY